MKSLTLHAPLALLPGGWGRDVRVHLGETGWIVSVEHGVPAASADRRLHDRVLLPAPSNLHSHAFQRALVGRTQARGRGEDSFWSWRELMYRCLDTLTPDMVRAIAAQSQVEMCEAGYAAVAEFHYLHHAPDGRCYADVAEMSASICEAAGLTGIGLTLLPVLYASAGADGRAPEAAQRRFACDLDGYESLWQRAAQLTERGADDWRIGVAPHSLRAVPREMLARLIDAHPSGPVHMHIAEQVAEVTEIERAWGARPVQWLLEHHAVNARWCLVHATHMDRHECERLAASRAIAGLCPVTEADLGDGIFSGATYAAAGGRLGVGTDSNVRIDLAGELRLLEYSQRLDNRRRNVLGETANEGTSFARRGEGTTARSTGRCLFDAALDGGADALGRNTGAIEAGRLADLLTLDTTAIELHGLDEDALLDGWIFSCRASPVAEVWSAGRPTVEQGRHVARDVVSGPFRAAMNALGR